MVTSDLAGLLGVRGRRQAASTTCSIACTINNNDPTTTTTHAENMACLLRAVERCGMRNGARLLV